VVAAVIEVVRVAAGIVAAEQLVVAVAAVDRVVAQTALDIA